jgi:uncharacterized membrane protein
MVLLGHTESGSGWGGPFEPWEIHPALNHLPIAFLLGGVVVDLYAWARGRPGAARVATGLLVAGVLTGVLTALAGLLAFFTVPGHTEEAHRLMYWHLGVQAAALLLFLGPAWARSRDFAVQPSPTGRLLIGLAAIALLIGSAIGGYIVYHGGAGVEPKLLSPAVLESHSHEGGVPHEREPAEHTHPSESGHSHEHG